MIDLNGQVSSIVITSKLAHWDISLFKGAANGLGGREISLLGENAHSIASSSLSGSLEFVYDCCSLGVLVNWESPSLDQPLLRQVLPWEVSEGSVWVFGGVLVLPGLIILIQRL